MSKHQYDNQLKAQAHRYPEIIEELAEGFRRGILEEGFAPSDVLKKARHIYLTGSGDSYSAVVAMEPCYIHYLTKLGTNIYVETPLVNSRYTRYLAEDTPAEACLTLLIAIGGGGFSPCVQEAFARAKAIGIPALGITQLPDMPVGADYCLSVSTPEISGEGPGCLGYAASLVSASLLAAHMAEVKGDFPAGTADSLADAMISLGREYGKCMEAFDDQAFQLAKGWKSEVLSFYGVGDGTDMASAKFLAAKAGEAAGVFGGFTNSVDWRHNVKHVSDAAGTCVIFFGEEGSDSRSSIAAAADEAFQLGFKVVFVGDVSAAEFGIKSPVASFQTPKAPEGYAYLAAYFNHLPVDILVSYFAALWEESL